MNKPDMLWRQEMNEYSITIPELLRYLRNIYPALTQHIHEFVNDDAFAIITIAQWGKEPNSAMDQIWNITIWDKNTIHQMDDDLGDPIFVTTTKEPPGINTLTPWKED